MLPGIQILLLLLAMPPAAAWPNETARFVSLGGGTYPLARCLDGSPSGYYIRTALRAEAASSWLFLLDGGGICTTREDCISRSSTDLGSSKGWPSSYNVNATDLTTPDPRNPLCAQPFFLRPACATPPMPSTSTMTSTRKKNGRGAQRVPWVRPLLT